METIIKKFKSTTLAFNNVYLNNLTKSQLDYFVQKFINLNYDYELLTNGLYKLYFIHISENNLKGLKRAIKNYKAN